MSKPDTNEISKRMADKYGLSLTVSEGSDAECFFYDIKPAEFEGQEGFAVRVKFGWRSIESVLVPGNFSARLINNMGESADTKKTMFAHLSDLAESKGFAVEIKLNENNIKAADIRTAKITWKKLSIKLLKSPTEVMADDKAFIENMILLSGGLLLSMIMSLLPLEESESLSGGEAGLPEGAKIRIEVNRYERNTLNREACIAIYGTKCSACGFDFENIYGEAGRDFIEVHHITPVSQLGENYIINPAEDLTPLCSNCHSIAHRRNPPYGADEIKDMIKDS